ncbi:MAG: hypothetical protein HC769_28780 [Cyanobacteria bacterium CRU_2_1]|nr:hypothetical protein [Cyanobacteria bacterium CRU_2_1]
MTNANFEHRLDQVEAIASILVTHVEAIDSRLENGYNQTKPHWVAL